MDIQQLVLSKYLFQKGQNVLREDTPFSPGLAVSLFQDSAEILLAAIATHVHANISRTPFLGFWAVIKNASGNPEGKDVLFGPEMTRINDARVGFKHSGNLPSKQDAIAFSGYTEQLLYDCMEKFLNVDFDDVSLADLINVSSG